MTLHPHRNITLFKNGNASVAVKEVLDTAISDEPEFERSHLPVSGFDVER